MERIVVNGIDLTKESLEDFCDRVKATDWERIQLQRIFEASYDRAGFLRSVFDFEPTCKYVEPGTFKK